MPTASVALLERWKSAQGIVSDYKAAQVLGISRGSPSNWRKGRSHAQAHVADKMARECGLDGLAILAAIEADRNTGDNGRCWARYGRGAFMALAIAVAVAAPLRPAQADVSPHYAKRTKLRPRSQNSGFTRVKPNRRPRRTTRRHHSPLVWRQRQPERRLKAS